MDRLTREEIAGAVARGYCTTANMHKELDADLVTAITNEVMALFQSLSQEAVRDEALDLGQFVNAAHIGGADAPHQVVEKLQRAINAAALKREPNAGAHFHPMALKMIAEWDCLNPPRSDLLNDLPWLKRLVDRALAGYDPRVETASQPDADKGTSEIEGKPAPAAPDVAEMVKRLRYLADKTKYRHSEADAAMTDAAALLAKLGQEQSPFVVNWTTEGCPKHHGQPWSFTASVYTEIAKRCPLCEPLPGASDE